MILSCRTGSLRGKRSLRDLYTGLGGMGGVGPRVARGAMFVTTNGSPLDGDRTTTGTRATKWPPSAQEARPAGPIFSAFAAEAVDESAVALGRAFGWRGVGHGAEEFALFGGFAAGFFAGFSFAVEGLGDGGGAALLA
jgi:hypothetical protein